MKAHFVLLVLSLCFLSAPLSASDLDNDGLDDDLEEALVSGHLPLIYFHEEEECPGPGVLLYRVRPYAPGVDSVVSASIVLLFYEDCGTIGHDGDAESFAMTLWRDDSCASGYRVHSLRTFAHLGNLLCSLTLTTGINRCDYGASEWDPVYVSKNTHAVYPSRTQCNDPDRFLCGDACEASLVMNDGFLVPPEVCQSWEMHNVGEPDHPFIVDLSEVNEGSVEFASTPIWDYRPFCGDEPYEPGDYCPASIVPKLFQCSSGPSLPVEVSLLGSGAVPSPMGFCRDQFLYLWLPYGAHVVAHIYDVAGDVIDKVYLPAFCSDEDLFVPYWDGGTVEGGCASPGVYYLLAEAHRGDNVAESDLALFGIAGDEGRPRSPSSLEAVGNSFSVSLSWDDRSEIEEAYLVERSLGTCPYAVVATLPSNTISYEDHPFYEGIARYRVMAHRTYGGNSGYSNEVELELRWDLTAPYLRGAEAPGDHAHNLAWHFDPGEAPFNWYSLLRRYKYPIGGITDEGVPPDWSAWFRIFETGERFDTLFVDTRVSDGVCFEYRVDAVVNDWADTLESNVRNFHGDCEVHGCPLLFRMCGGEERRITNLFPSIELWPSSGIVSDVVYLGEWPEEEGGMRVLKIEEVGGDTSFIDGVALYSTPDSEEISYGLTSQGRIVACGEPVAPLRALDDAGSEMTGLVREADGLVYFGQPGGSLVLEFPRGDGADSLFGIINPLDDPPAKAIGPAIFIRHGSRSEEWTHVETVFPHQDGSAALVNLSPFLRRGMRIVRVRLVWLRETAIDRLFLTRGRDESGQLEEHMLLRAVTDEGADVTEMLSRPDGNVVMLEEGEAILIYFHETLPQSGEREYFFESSGRYAKRMRCGR
jgi:hypothetical protein